MDLFGELGKKGMKWSITLPESGLSETVHIKEGDDKEPLRGIKNAYITDVATDESGKILYDITYKHDEFGRRIVEEVKNVAPDKFAIWFGCGDIYGMGVSGKETIPQIFSEKNAEYKSYNYGFAGIGAQYPLRILETTNLKNELKEAYGMMIYVISEAHYPKTLGKFLHIYRPEMPNYKLINNDLVYRGTFRESEPYTYWFKMLFGNSWLKRMLGDVNELTTYSESEHQLVCAVITNTRKEFLKQFSNSKFILFLHANLRENERIRLTKCANDNEIDIVDTTISYDESKFESDKVDAHPTFLLNESLVDVFSKYVKGKIIYSSSSSSTK